MKNNQLIAAALVVGVLYLISRSVSPLPPMPTSGLKEGQEWVWDPTPGVWRRRKAVA